MVALFLETERRSLQIVVTVYVLLFSSVLGIDTQQTQKLCHDVLRINCDLQYMADDNEEVCGTDHHTYQNTCDFVQAKCKDITLDQAYDGQCRKTYMNVIELLIAENKVSGGVTKTSLPTSRKNVVQSTNSPASVPTRPGSLLTRPGSSITSEANFKTGTTSPTVKRSSTTPSASTKQSEGREFCDIGYVCPDTLFPVCGSNGVFYLNICKFEIARCTEPDLETQSDLTNCENDT